MSTMSLAPNEVIGYRLYPDAYNWTVVVVKKHGKDSKYAGEEYESSLAYPKTLQFAVDWIFNYVAKVEGRVNQVAEFKETGNFASIDALIPAFEKARDEAIKAVVDLEKRLKDAGLDLSNIKNYLKAGEVEVSSE